MEYLRTLRFLIVAACSLHLCNCTYAQKKPQEVPWNESRKVELDKTTLSERDLVSGINLPWDISWGPDDHIWVTERGGRVLRVEPETGVFEVVLEHPDVVDGAERGMFGLTHHPDWKNHKEVYIVYTNGQWKEGTARERLSVFQWSQGKLINEKVLLEFSAHGWHNGSRLVITPDHKILMSTGEVGLGSESSQNLESLNGKILRINLDGSIPKDNPDPASYVYSYGHRNPQGLAIGPNGIIYSSEHGQSANDEFNIIEAKGNYGWPHVEGNCDTDEEKEYCSNQEVVEPVMEWTPSMGVTGIEYYNHPAIPEWRNSILAAVLGGMRGPHKHMAVLHLSKDGRTVIKNERFLSSLNERVRDICVNPHTGAVYVALNGSAWPGQGPNVIKEYRNREYSPKN